MKPRISKAWEWDVFAKGPVFYSSGRTLPACEEWGVEFHLLAPEEMHLQYAALLNHAFAL